MNTKKRMPGDFIFDHLYKVNSRVIYCDPDVEMMTRTKDGRFITSKISEMSKEDFDKRFEILLSLFGAEHHVWDLPVYSNDPNADEDVKKFYNNASILLNIPTSMSDMCDLMHSIDSELGRIKVLCWDYSSDNPNPIRDDRLHLKVPNTDIKIVVPLSDVVAKKAEVYINGKNILDYYRSDSKTIFARNCCLDDCWRNGIIDDGISMNACEYKWVSKYKIYIRRHYEPECYNIECYHIKEFCGKNPKYILYFE